MSVGSPDELSRRELPLIVALSGCYFASKAKRESVDQNLIISQSQGFVQLTAAADVIYRFLCSKGGNMTREIHGVTVRQHNQTTCPYQSEQVSNSVVIAELLPCRQA